MSRLDERSEASVASLVDCAEKRFGESGYDTVALSSIASEAGLTKGAVYHHFGSKRALFEATFRRSQRALVDRVIQQSTGSPDAIEALVRGVRTYFQAMLDPGTRRILLVEGPSVLGWQEWHRCEEPGFRSLLTATLGAARNDGTLRPEVRPEEAAEMLLGALTGCALALADCDEPEKQASRYAREFETLLGGLTVRAA